MARKSCLFNKCNGPSKWKLFGIAVEEAVTYSKLLGQKRGFQQFIEFDNKISKSGKMDSYFIVDKRYSPSKGRNIDICIFDDAEHHGALYLGYSVHKQYINRNCNEIITFLNSNKYSTFHLHNSFIYIKSTDRFKWVLFFGILEFFIKNLNMSIIGSQFYFPLFSKYLLMNELRLLLMLQHSLTNLNTNLIKSLPDTSEISELRLQKALSSGATYSISMVQNLKNKTSFPSEQAVKKLKNTNTHTCKANQQLQLKRKSLDSYTRDDCLSNTKRFKSERSVCHCQNNSWKIFTAFQKTSILNYTSILEDKKLMDDSEVMHVFPINCNFQADYMQNANSFAMHQNHSRLKLDSSEKFSAVQLFDKVTEFKNITDKCIQVTEEIPKYEHISDVHTFKENEVASCNRECSTFDKISNLHLSTLECAKVEYKNEETYSKATNMLENQINIASTSGENLPKSGIFGINEQFVTFQTASGKALKISEAALQAAEKIFENISSENLDIFSKKKVPNASQLNSIANDKHRVGFQTASGKSLHTSKVALEAAEKLLNEISVEETDIFPEKLTQTKANNNKALYPCLRDCDDINEVLAEDFFEDSAFDEKETDSKPTDDSATLIVQKSETTKVMQTRKRKSLGGRRTLKPYAFKK